MILAPTSTPGVYSVFQVYETFQTSKEMKSFAIYFVLCKIVFNIELVPVPYMNIPCYFAFITKLYKNTINYIYNTFLFTVKHMQGLATRVTYCMKLPFINIQLSPLPSAVPLLKL